MPYVGEIRLASFGFAPNGWYLCDGRLLDIATNTQLFASIGATYGGDGQTNFAVPDLRGRTPVGVGSATPLAQAGGTESVTLTGPQVANHSHSILASPGTGDSSVPTNNYFCGAPNKPYSSDPPTGFTAPLLGPSAGESRPHENRSPSFCLSFIIAALGDRT